MEEKYVFIKPYNGSEGTIPENSEIIVFRGSVYFNGGLVSPAYQKMFLNMINDNNFRNEYLKSIKLLKNKI